jgi:chemotaxis receptor (MCP) glutamine deamidase CheD
MNTTIVDVADIQFSRNPKDILEIPSLGSCVCFLMFDPDVKIGGAVVFVLPSSDEIQHPQLDKQPCMFADTAIINFLQAAMEEGLRPERSKRVIVGGAQVLGQVGDFDLGNRNSQAAMETLAKLELEPTHQSLGGVLNRTAALHIRTGTVHISVAGNEIENI